MRFERKIKYLDYLENGERVRSGGFLKLETAEELFKMELTVKGVRGVKEAAWDVILCGNGREESIGKMLIEDGQGEFRYTCHMDSEIGDTGIGCDELAGIRIPLGEGREIACIWQREMISAERAGKSSEKPSEKQRQPERQRQREKLSERQNEKQRQVEKQPVKQIQSEKLPADQVERTAGASAGQKGDVILAEHKVISEQKEERKETVRETVVKEPPEAAPLKENKWLQLCAIYPHINPFQDQREYLSIGPEDFVLLSEDSYRAAGNSFMLHGYYNYRHLILAREERRGRSCIMWGFPETIMTGKSRWRSCSALKALNALRNRLSHLILVII